MDRRGFFQCLIGLAVSAATPAESSAPKEFVVIDIPSPVKVFDCVKGGHEYCWVTYKLPTISGV